jgi:mannosyltransferase
VRPLWHDEVFTVWVSRLAPGGLLRALSYDSGPPLFYLLEKPFVAATEGFGLSDNLARLLPFLALLLLFAGARSLPPGGPRRRFLLLAASSPFLLLYAAEARAYAVLALLGFALFLLCDNDPPARGARRTALIALTTALLLWTHYLAIFLVASLLVVAVVQRRRSAFGIGAGILLFLPWVPVLLVQPRAATSWIREPVGNSAVGFLAALGGGIRMPAPMGRPLPMPLLFLSCAAGIALIAALILLRPRQPQTRAGLAVVLLTLGGILAASFWRPVAFAGRSEMAVIPIWLWLLARSAEDSRALRQAAGAAAALGAVASLLALVSPRPARPNASLVATLETVARNGDSVIATTSLYLPARLERDRGRLAAELRAFPADIADHPGWFLARAPSEEDYRRLSQDLDRLRPGHSVFLLLDTPFWTPRLQEILAAFGPARPLVTTSGAMLVVSSDSVPRVR